VSVGSSNQGTISNEGTSSQRTNNEDPRGKAASNKPTALSCAELG
jgi:hypothetical protein